MNSKKVYQRRYGTVRGSVAMPVEVRPIFERPFHYIKNWIFKRFKSLSARYWRSQVRKGIKALHMLDIVSIRAGFTRQERRQMWREFIKHARIRQKILENISRGLR